MHLTRMRCYTIGHSNREIDEFIELLKERGIQVLVDVRSYPRSRHTPYNKDELRETLDSNDIKYVHMPGVGGFQRLPYEEYMETREFNHYYDILVAKIREHGGRVALMCAEKDPEDCHRQYLSRRLEQDDIRVIHIVEAGQTSLFSFNRPSMSR